MTSTIDKLLYTAKAHTTGGRDGGHSRTDDGNLDVRFTTPGRSGNGTNPEQLLAAGWSACFLSALKHVAAGKKVRVPENVSIDPEIDLGIAQGNFTLAARLNVHLPGLDEDVARKLVEEAHQTCPYSRATRGNIEVALNVFTQPVQQAEAVHS